MGEDNHAVRREANLSGVLSANPPPHYVIT
jgi:hypothetical protein